MPSGHAVIDGSNLATEGRTEPSLQQLRDAAAAFRDEHDFALVTVIVDASFEHRVSSREKKPAREAIEANEFITPPAGVVGRGDRFILEVAERAGAVVVSNDSFQEFHALYPWLLQEGRLVGGKPVPEVGWVFVPRLPVKGPVSRKARTSSSAKSTESETAAPPEKVPAQTKKTAAKKTAAKKTAAKKAGTASSPSATTEISSATPSRNRPAVWTAFRRRHPTGSPVTVTVESFVSHGAIGRSGNAVLYIPLSLLGRPAPRRAREVLELGGEYPMFVHGFDEQRKSIDVGLIEEASGDATTPGTSAKKPAAKKAAAKKPAAKKAPAKKAPAKKAAAKKAPAKKPAAKKAPAKKAPAKKAAATRSPATKSSPAQAAATTPRRRR